MLNENVEELRAWLFANRIIEPRVACWVPNFIMFTGHIKFAEMSGMSPQMLYLARS